MTASFAGSSYCVDFERHSETQELMIPKIRIRIQSKKANDTAILEIDYAPYTADKGAKTKTIE